MSDRMIVNLTNKEGDSVITVVVPGDPRTYMAHETHKNWAKIIEGIVVNKDPAALDLFDVALTAGMKLRGLTERITYAPGHLFFDGDEMHGTLVEHLVRVLEDGFEHKTWESLARFYENLANNPSEQSRERLYDWLHAENFSITDDGEIVGYKSVVSSRESRKSADEEDVYTYVSVHAGPAIVDGEVHMDGRVPNQPGSVISMARSTVDPNTFRDCSDGLHVGTFGYARGFSGDTVMEVRVNPRDVVSVPGHDKMRVCRYRIVGPVTAQYAQPIVHDEPEEETGYDPDQMPYEAPPGDYEVVMGDTPSQEPAEPQEAAQSVTEAPNGDNEPTQLRHPSKAAFDTFLEQVKSRRQSAAKLGRARGWTLHNEDEPKVRESWIVP